MKQLFGRDLRDPRWMILKAVLFAVLLVASFVEVVLATEVWRRLLLACVLVWSSARLYYFCFYVIERYIDPSFRFSGLLDVVRYWWRVR